MESGHNQQSTQSGDDDTPDTVTLARLEREKQGPWEVEVSYGGEADLHRHLKNCNKNPGHVNFVPVDQFNVDHLPSGCQDNDLVDLIQAMSHLTVRISVTYVSEDRPETVPKTNIPYPCYSNRGENMMRVGTGWVWNVEKYLDVEDEDCDYRICTCKECKNSPSPKTRFARIFIYTAAHVVFEGIEGANTTCHLFFDRGNLPQFCCGVVELNGMSDVWTDVGQDWSEMVYVTHDLGLADRLDRMVGDYKFFLERVQNKYPSPKSDTEISYPQGGSVPETWHSLTIIVSHPHGCSKQISVGHCASRDEVDGWTKLTYSTATCPGSSGAYVFVMGGDLWNQWVLRRVHCGNCEEDKALNYCAHGID